MTICTKFLEETVEGGFIRLVKWPEGYVLYYHGEIVWKSWEKKKIDEITLKLKVVVE